MSKLWGHQELDPLESLKVRAFDCFLSFSHANLGILKLVAAEPIIKYRF